MRRYLHADIFLRRLLPPAALLFVTLVVYGPALRHGFLSTWDDDRYVTANEAVCGLSGAHLKAAFTSYYSGNYAPLQIVSYMLDYTLWGLDARGFILTNILLHAFSGVLLFLLVLALSRQRLAACLAAGLFLLHPAQVESVVWVSQRKNVLAMVFFLLALHAWRLYRTSGDGLSRRWYGAAIGAFCAALLTKSVTVVLPLALLLYDLCFLEKEERRHWLLDKLPFLAAAGLTALLAFHSQSAEFHGGRTGYLQDSPWVHFLTMLPVFARYLGLLFWPTHLSALYQPPVKGGPDVEVAAAALLLFLLASGAWLLFRRRRELAYWYLLIFVGFLPVSQLVPLVTLMNDRYLYFPMLGVAGLFGCAAAATAGCCGRSGQRLVAVAAFSLLVPLGVLTAERVPVWRNSLSLWSDTVRKVPGSKEAWLFLAETIYLDGRDPQGSLGPYLKVLDLDPDLPFVTNSVGAYGDTGRFLREHLALKALVAREPGNRAALLRLAQNYESTGNRQEAVALYRRLRVKGSDG